MAIDRSALTKMLHLTHDRHVPPTCPVSAALQTHSDAHVQAVLGAHAADAAVFRPTFRGTTVKKIVIVVGATLALVTAASAADLPRRQPVYPQAQAPVGKMPIGKTPIGKSPIGKAPGPVVSRY
jgi:hypothetical protein